MIVSNRADGGTTTTDGAPTAPAAASIDSDRYTAEPTPTCWSAEIVRRSPIDPLCLRAGIAFAEDVGDGAEVEVAASECCRPVRVGVDVVEDRLER